jgi:hypothetical protein
MNQLSSEADQRRSRVFDRPEGVDFVRCLIWGEAHRVISGRHLSKHDMDRQSYMEKYGLSPDQLIARDFRQIQSSRRNYYPYSKDEWIAAFKKIYRRKGKITTKYLQRHHPGFYHQGVWLFGNWDEALRAVDMEPETTRLRNFASEEEILAEIDQIRGEEIPLNPSYVLRHYPKLFARGRRRWGTWKNTMAVWRSRITEAPDSVTADRSPALPLSCQETPAV